MSKTIVVIPTYNEVESIGSLLDELATLDLDVLVIDDGSPDGTAQICKAHGVEVVEHHFTLPCLMYHPLPSLTA